MRILGIFERATLIANRHAPFNIVSVLQLENAPTPEILHAGARKLQLRHPLLRSRVVKKGAALHYEAREPGDFHFEVIEKASDEQWHKIIEREMAHRFDPRQGPLFRVTYLYGQGNGDIILTLHHGITDAVSGMNLLDELLRFCAGDSKDLAPLEVIPPAEERFPAQHQGFRRLLSFGRYVTQQMADMLSYLFRARNKRQPPFKTGGSGKIFNIQLPEELVNQLSRIGRRNGITLNSLLNATQVLAVHRHLYQGKSLPLRTFSFASLRPYTTPPTNISDLGSYISMLVYTLDLTPETEVWQLAAQHHEKIYPSLKSGIKFNALLMSENLLKFFTSSKSMRFGTTALNYSSHVSIKGAYGDIRVIGLHGYVSAYDLGPELASQARLFQDQIWWDFGYLDTDMDEQTASAIAEEIIKILEQAASKEP